VSPLHWVGGGGRRNKEHRHANIASYSHKNSFPHSQLNLTYWYLILLCGGASRKNRHDAWRRHSNRRRFRRCRRNKFRSLPISSPGISQLCLYHWNYSMYVSKTPSLFLIMWLSHVLKMR